MVIAIARGIFVLLLYLQNINGQQGLNNNGLPQQVQKSGAVPQNTAFQFNAPQQGNVPQMTLQPFNPSVLQSNTQSQSNFQDNTQVVSGRSNQLSDIFSALHNIRLAQTSNASPSFKIGSCSKQNIEQPNQSFTINKYNQGPSTSDSSISQPSFNFKFIPVTPQNGLKQNSQYYLTPSQNQVNSQQPNYLNQPSVANPQMSTQQSSTIIPVSSSQVNPVHSQPIVFTLQSPQFSDIPVLSQPLTQNPVMYTVQTQPGQTNQQMNSNVQNPIDSQSIMSFLMSQFQGPSGHKGNSGNSVSPMLPALMNTKQEKSSGMKALLPLLLNLLNDRNGCCNQCGCSSSSPCDNNAPSPTIYSGYSNQKDYTVKAAEIKPNVVKPKVVPEKTSKKTVVKEVSDEASDEDEEYEDEDDEVEEK